MKESLMNINKTKYRYLLDNSEKYLDKTAITYTIPIEKGETPEDSVDLNRVYKDIDISKRKLIEEINKTADALTALGIKKGDIVLICSSNTPETIYMDYALNKIGAIPDYIYPNVTSNEMKYFINEANVKYVFMLDEPEIRKTVLNACENSSVEKIISASVIESFPIGFKTLAGLKLRNNKKQECDIEIKWSKFMDTAKRNKGIAKEVPYEENAILNLMHTSGTTSTPKAVMQSNKNVNSVVKNFYLSGMRYIPGHCYLQVIPIFVSYGSSSFQAMFCNNIRVVMLPEMNPKNFPGLIHKYKPNYLTATPSHWGAMLKSKVIEDEDLSGFMSVGTGGDGFANVEDRILSFLRQHKCEEVVSDGYGSTEVSAIASSNININYKKGTLGKPLGEVEVKVYDAENDKILGPNEIGEFIITGPTVTLGYYNDPEKTAEVYKKHSDGKTWVHMGDLGRIDEDGFLHYEGRIKNIIARKSFKFSPDSEEKLIESLPNVKECRIVGIPSTEEGQVPSCHITLHDYSNIERDLEIIYDFCTKNFQELHMPCQFKIRKDLPLTKNNKINLNALRLEDIATLVPGVMSCEIRPVNNAQYDYELDINVNYDIASSFDVKNDEDVVKNINQLIRSEKLSNCSIKFNINSVSTKYVDSAIKKVKSKLKAL